MIWDSFNQLYDLDWIEKDIRNSDIVAHKLRPALIRVTNCRLKIVKEKEQKGKDIVENEKAESMATKRYGARRKISLSSEERD